ncbi:MAG: triphosphoribosyl-dephospho-CoA synthase, partial [Planctomycetales bacterium]|nr:triphosphoribosyl-dephospho-CoA synthase [Planctomycetales bacterium]
VMSKFPDSLIARKCGTDVADQAARRAANVLAAGPIGSTAYHSALRELDSWLRADQHLRNPGRSADLATAGIFVALRDLNVNLKATSMFSNASPFLQHDQSTSL